MDCRTARQALEVVRPDGTGLQALEGVASPNGMPLEGTDAETVSAHLERCSDCRSAFASLQARDRVLSYAFSNVPFPPGLHGRLRAALHLPETESDVLRPIASELVANTIPACAERIRLPVSTSDLDGSSGPRIDSRRNWLKVCAMVAACLLCGFGVWFGVSRGNSVQIETAEILDRVASPAYDVAQAPNFRGTFAARLPAAGQMLSPASLLGAQPKSLENSAGQEIGAVYAFQIPSRRGSAAEAVLIVVPRQKLTGESLARLGRSFSTVPLQYPHSHATKVWSDGELVYVCLVRSGQPEALESLRPRVYAS